MSNKTRIIKHIKASLQTMMLFEQSNLNKWSSVLQRDV